MKFVVYRALGYNGGDISWSDELKIDGTKYDMDMENVS